MCIPMIPRKIDADILVMINDKYLEISLQIIFSQILPHRPLILPWVFEPSLSTEIVLCKSKVASDLFMGHVKQNPFHHNFITDINLIPSIEIAVSMYWRTHSVAF